MYDYASGSAEPLGMSMYTLLLKKVEKKQF